MKSIYLLCSLFVFLSCSQGEYLLPTFTPITDADSLVLVGNGRIEAWEEEIIAIDCRTSQTAAVYSFKRGFFHGNPYFYNSTDAYFPLKMPHGVTLVRLNLVSGKMNEICKDSYGWIGRVGDKIYYSNDYDSTNHSYDPKTGEITPVTAYGTIITSSDIVINGKSYITTYVRDMPDYDSESESEFPSKLYNLTDQKRITLQYGNTPFRMFLGKYILSLDPKRKRMIHEVFGFEPENFRFIMGTRKIVTGIFEDENFLYVVSNDDSPVDKVRKSDGKIVASCLLPEEKKKGGRGVFKNGYVWMGAVGKSGDFYRIETTDEDEDGVLQWELLEN